LQFILLNDGAQFTNHDRPANLDWGRDDETWVAARDIKTGEELTFDYREFGYNHESEWLLPLCQQHCPRAIAFEYERKLEWGEKKK